MSEPSAPMAGRSLPAARFAPGLNEETLAWLILAILIVGGLLWASHGRICENTDFSITYVGAKLIHDGNYSQLYDLKAQARLRDSLYLKASPLIFEHPPFEAFLLSPLAALPYKSAYLVWGLFNAAIWLALPCLLRPYAPVPRETLGYFALWFLFAPLGDALFQGQSSLLLLFLYVMTYLNLRRGKDWKAGMCIGFGLFKFQFVLPFVLIFLLRKQWRFLTGFAFSAALLGALSIIAIGWRGILSYIQLLLNIAGHPSDASYGNAVGMATVQGFIHATMGNVAGPMVVSCTVGIISLALVGVVAWRWNREEGPNFEASLDIMFAVSIVIALVNGFHMFMHDLSPMILALFLVAAHFPERESPVLRVTLASCMALLWIPPVLFVLMALKGFYLLFPPLLIFAGAALRLPESRKAE